jgi:hypothetical protein
MQRAAAIAHPHRRPVAVGRLGGAQCLLRPPAGSRSHDGPETPPICLDREVRLDPLNGAGVVDGLQGPNGPDEGLALLLYVPGRL